MRVYCTLFDSKFLSRGLVLYESLRRFSSHRFMLYVLAMDADCLRALEKLNLDSVIPVGLDVFERETGIQMLRENRTWQEYCWTCASIFTEYVLNQDDLYYSHRFCTYLDADMMFFSDPEQIFMEIFCADIAIIPHRFSSDKRHLACNGNFNVSWVSFRNTTVGRACLQTWAGQCREWCYYRNEDGKFGDQKYLDAWPERYGDALRIIENIGAGLAPWNLPNYQIELNTGRVYVDDVPLVFYHYHEFQPQTDGSYKLTNYALRETDIRLIYAPYIAALERAKERIWRSA